MAAAKEAKDIAEAAKGKELKKELIVNACSRQNSTVVSVAVPECTELYNEDKNRST